MTKKNILNVLGLEIKKRLALNEMANLVLEKSDEIIPVDTGNLKNSKYSRIYNNNNSVEVGYTAEYAKAVHEGDKSSWEKLSPEEKAKIMARYKEREKKGEKKKKSEIRFLEKAMNSTRQERLAIIKKRLSI